jgi:hypothetical protein
MLSFCFGREDCTFYSGNYNTRIVGLHPQNPRHFARQPSARSTNLAVLQPQSCNCSCYVSRRMPAPPSLWLQKHIYLRAHEFVHCPELWHQSRLANVTCSWSWVPCGINPVIHLFECHGSGKPTCSLWFTIQLLMICRVIVGWLVYDELEFMYKEAVVSLLRYHFCIFLDWGKPLKS